MKQLQRNLKKTAKQREEQKKSSLSLITKTAIQGFHLKISKNKTRSESNALMDFLS